MLAAPLLHQHSFSVHFPRVQTIRRAANELEDALNAGCPGGYGAPQLFPIPDDLGPEVPRIVFNAVSGFSTIAVSQLSMALTVNYSDDWQRERGRCADYLKRRAHVLFEMLSRIKIDASFVGIGTQLQIMSDSNDNEEVMAALRNLLSSDLDLCNANEIMIRVSNNVDETYFNNTVVSNVAMWPDADALSGRFPKETRIATGISIAGDFNNRRSYNENVESKASLDESLTMIDMAIESAYSLAGRFRGDYA
ncbi:hypothetical protein UU9_06734 [Rhodanobacter fulvus Jip2]|uniref:Uncharacterized protein n=1 Tax=Rhodanobacter fulvus Jip2 TaxID=1163408 RepID=I4VTE0_9GAMM|nr:hypothetical protein [Rhodanobacter fulvus]EIL90481.1 hypothetical protein UU9_06734 [Rhodanobacter fulvus Jip2]